MAVLFASCLKSSLALCGHLFLRPPPRRKVQYSCRGHLAFPNKFLRKFHVNAIDDSAGPVMSGPLLSARWAPLMRRGITSQRSLHRAATGRAGGLLKVDSIPSLGTPKPWPFGASSIHIVPTVRSISFARVLPQLALKMVRLPALLGASMIAGLAYIQYQAARKLNDP